MERSGRVMLGKSVFDSGPGRPRVSAECLTAASLPVRSTVNQKVAHKTLREDEKSRLLLRELAPRYDTGSHKICLLSGKPGCGVAPGVSASELDEMVDGVSKRNRKGP